MAKASPFVKALLFQPLNYKTGNYRLFETPLNRLPQRLLAIALCFWAIGLYAAPPQDPLTVQLPVMEVMPDAESVWIGEKMAVNGIAMSTRTFKVNREPERVLEYYRARWKSRGLGSIAENQAGDYQVLGFEQNGFYQSVQVKAVPNGAEGILTVTTSPAESHPNKETQFPKMLNTEVISKIESLDADVRAETLTLTNNRTADANANYIYTSLTTTGWSHQAFANQPTSEHERILFFQKEKQHCQVTINSRAPEFPGRTLILVHWVKN